MTDPTETATKEPTIVTVFELHDADGALDAADMAEECSQELEAPLRMR